MRLSTGRRERFPTPVLHSTGWKDRFPSPELISIGRSDRVPSPVHHGTGRRDYVILPCAPWHWAEGQVPHPCAPQHRAQEHVLQPLCTTAQGGGTGFSTPVRHSTGRRERFPTLEHICSGRGDEWEGSARHRAPPTCSVDKAAQGGHCRAPPRASGCWWLWGPGRRSDTAPSLLAMRRTAPPLGVPDTLAPGGGGGSGAGQREVGTIAPAQWCRSSGLWSDPRPRCPGRSGGGGEEARWSDCRILAIPGPFHWRRPTPRQPLRWRAGGAHRLGGSSATPPPRWWRAPRNRGHASSSVDCCVSVSG